MTMSISMILEGTEGSLLSGSPGGQKQRVEPWRKMTYSQKKSLENAPKNTYSNEHPKMYLLL